MSFQSRLLVFLHELVVQAELLDFLPYRSDEPFPRDGGHALRGRSRGNRAQENIAAHDPTRYGRQIKRDKLPGW
jgi:hypothetical protein